MLTHPTCPFKATQHEALALGIPMIHRPEVKRRVQWALQKKGYHRNSNSYVGSCAVKPTFPYRNSLGMEQSHLHCAVTTSCPPINESQDGLPHARHYEFISWKPVHLQSPIGFNHPTLLIKPIRCTGFHHPQPANTGSKCQ
jgi:hypothetical protein